MDRAGCNAGQANYNTTDNNQQAKLLRTVAIGGRFIADSLYCATLAATMTGSERKKLMTIGQMISKQAIGKSKFASGSERASSQASQQAHMGSKRKASMTNHFASRQNIKLKACRIDGCFLRQQERVSPCRTDRARCSIFFVYPQPVTSSRRSNAKGRHNNTVSICRIRKKPFLHCPLRKGAKAHNSGNFLGLGEEDSFFYSLNSQQNLFSKLNFNFSIIREKPPDIASLLSFLFFQQQVDGVNLTSANIFHHSHPPSTIRTDHRSTFTSDPVNWLVLIIISLLIYESAVLSNLEEWEKGKRTNIADVSFVFVDNAESRGKKPSAEEKQEEEEKRGKLEEEQ
ncbi:hypothetical protein T07_14683 [Trichinella nelsoni]|uniref:Uncharacterized protein n=1 Tax=Trichinella nelsoni TaxID=6336 RepID=A0A0V0RGD2_9BILA|nr:hypothetical protein T07_14683 [Trichinella nelsoni]